jgi:CheY-like chemotaxis protein
VVRGGEEILLLEDNPHDVLLTERALKKNGLMCGVVVARDGEEALGYLKMSRNTHPSSPSD